jgi:hypothetical protein
VSSVGWYVNNGFLRHMTYDRSLFGKNQEQQGGMTEELGDDATYPLRGVGFISFWMPLGDVLELDHILLVPGLRKNLLSVSCMTYIHWRVAVEGQECTFNACCLASPRTLAIGVREGGLYRLLFDPVAHVHSSCYRTICTCPSPRQVNQIGVTTG